MIRLAAIAVLPLMMAFEINLIGTMFAGELVVLALLPVLLMLRFERLRRPDLGLLLGLLALYMLAQALTDVVRGTALNELLRGWSRLLFFTANFLVLYLLVGTDRRRILLYVCAAVAGGVLYQFIRGDLPLWSWKVGFAKPVTIVALLALVALPFLAGRRLVVPLALVGLAVLNLYLDYRSLAGVLLVTACLVALPALLRWLGHVPRPLPWRRLVPLTMLIMAIGIGALEGYGHAAKSGWLGEGARRKHESQAALGDLGVLLGGRSEALASLAAIRDRPLLGHGSWPSDPKYAELQATRLWQLGFTPRYLAPQTDLIPTHSHLFGAWVEAGIGGAAFWFGVILMVIRGLGNLHASRDPLRPMFLYILVLFLWDILFSPFAGFRRVDDAFALLVMLRALRRGQARPAAGLGRSRLRWVRRLRHHGRRRRRRRAGLPGPAVGAPAA